MKRKFGILLISLLILASCSNTNNDNQAVPTSESLDGNFTVFGGSVGGIWSVFTEGVAESVRREYPGTQISAVPGTVAGNPVAVDQEKADFAISESLTALFAYEGSTPFTEPHEDI